MIQEDLLLKVTAKLHQLKIPYMITGGIAVIFYGRPRLTYDFDFVVTIRPGQISGLMKAFQDEFYISQEAIQNALKTQSMFNMVHFEKDSLVQGIRSSKASGRRTLDFRDPAEPGP